ncbi:unnamed protein product [Arctogadus glacialis]
MLRSDRVNPSSPALPSWDTRGGFHRPYSRGRALIPCLIKPIQRLNRTQVLLKRRRHGARGRRGILCGVRVLSPEPGTSSGGESLLQSPRRGIVFETKRCIQM